LCQRAGVETFGISFPGHFLVGARRRDRTLAVVDPFDGRMVRRPELRALIRIRQPGIQLTSTSTIWCRPRDADPGARAQTTCALSTRCAAINAGCGFVLERMSVLSPSDEVRSRLNALVADVAIAPRVSVN